MYLDYQNDNLLCVQFGPTNSLCGGLPQFFNQNKLLGRIPRLQPLQNEKNGSDQLPIPFCSSVPECCCIDYFSKEAQAGCLKVCFLREHFWIPNPVNVMWIKLVWAVYQTIFPLNRKLFWHETLGEWLKYSTFYSTDSGRLTFFKERARSQERLELWATNSHQTMSQWLPFAKNRESSQSNRL